MRVALHVAAMGSPCRAYRTIFAISLDVNGGTALAQPMSMPSGSEGYRDYAIHWDTIPTANGPWDAKAGLVSPADSSGFFKIIALNGGLFASESEARDYIVRAAKKQIDEMVSIQKHSAEEAHGENDSPEQVR
jgi:hypothetical protein